MSMRTCSMFQFAVLLSISLGSISMADDSVLGRFVGSWDLTTTAKPAKWAPDGGEFTGRESTVWALDEKVILIRDMNQPGGRKGLWVATYDDPQKAYLFSGFDSNGLQGAQWIQTWDSERSSMTGHATDLPEGWTSSGKNHFTDNDTNVVTAWIKDENGDLLLDQEGKKTRRTERDVEDFITAWLKNEPAEDRPQELDVLKRMVGTWDTVSTIKPAEWTPDGGVTAAVVNRQWILNGRFVIDMSSHADGEKSMALISYDSQAKSYRNWWFNSKGHRNQSRGTWDEAAQTFSFEADLPDGKSMQSSVRFADENREVWAFKVTDAEGKVYFDMDIVATRRKSE